MDRVKVLDLAAPTQRPHRLCEKTLSLAWYGRCRRERVFSDVGWCARFHTLHKDWQDMIIQRTEQMM